MERQKVQVHILPTENASNILINKESTLVITNNSYTSSNPQHLYFTSDEKIEEGDWCIVNGGLGRIGVDRYQVNVKYSIKPLKVVATTDKSLWEHDDTVPYPKKRPALPQIPQSFIKQYVEADGKINEVEIVYEWNGGRAGDYGTEIKVDSNNCVIVHY